VGAPSPAPTAGASASQAPFCLPLQYDLYDFATSLNQTWEKQGAMLIQLNRGHGQSCFILHFRFPTAYPRDGGEADKPKARLKSPDGSAMFTLDDKKSRITP